MTNSSVLHINYNYNVIILEPYRLLRPCPHVRKISFPHRFPWQRFRNFSIMMNSLQKTHLAVETLKYILRPMWHWFSTKKEETKAEHAHKTCTNPNTKTHRSVFILWDLVSEKCVFVHRNSSGWSAQTHKTFHKKTYVFTRKSVLCEQGLSFSHMEREKRWTGCAFGWLQFATKSTSWH